MLYLQKSRAKFQEVCRRIITELAPHVAVLLVHLVGRRRSRALDLKKEFEYRKQKI